MTEEHPHDEYVHTGMPDIPITLPPEQVLEELFHEIKHPLNSLKGWTELFLIGAFQDNPIGELRAFEAMRGTIAYLRMVHEKLGAYIKARHAQDDSQEELP